MLPKISSIYQSELEVINQFLSGLQTVKKVIKNQISNTIKLQKFALNKSPLLNDSLFCLRNKNNPNQISIKNFLNKCVDRWYQEALYQQDIFSLKDQIIDEFEKLCSHVEDENCIETGRKQREKIVETLFVKTQFDQKQLAGDFCKSFMNGFEIEMIDKIEYYATYIVWMPFTTPLPEELIEFIKKLLHDEVIKPPSAASIVSASAKIIKYIEDQLIESEIKVKRWIFEENTLLGEKKNNYD